MTSENEGCYCELDICNRKYVNCKCVNKNEIHSKIVRLMDEGELLQFVGYWGATNKSHTDGLDRKAISLFEEYVNFVTRICRNKCEWIIYLADIHALQNGYLFENIMSYLSEIKQLLSRIPNLEIRYLSRFWKENNIFDALKEQQDSVEKNWNQNKLSWVLERQASKYNTSQISDRKSAQNYFCIRRIESDMISKLHNQAIFYTYSTSYMQPLYPSLPCLYLWSLKRGTSKPPWLP